MILLFGMFYVATAVYVVLSVAALGWTLVRSVAARRLRDIVRARRGVVAIADMDELSAGLARYPNGSLEILFVHIDNLFAAYLLDGVILLGARTKLRAAINTNSKDQTLDAVLCHWRDSDELRAKRAAHLLGDGGTPSESKVPRLTRRQIKRRKSVRTVLMMHTQRFYLEMVYGP